MKEPPEGMRMFRASFSMVGEVEIPAHDEEEARHRAIHDAILPALSAYDVKRAHITKVEVVGGKLAPGNGRHKKR